MSCEVRAAGTSDRPYALIIERNIFGLKPAPAPAPTVESNRPPTAKIILTGITTILGDKRTLLKVLPPQRRESHKGRQPFTYCPKARRKVNCVFSTWTSTQPL